MKKFHTIIILLSLSLFINSCELPSTSSELNPQVADNNVELDITRSLQSIVPDSSSTPFDFFSNRGNPNPDKPQMGVLSILVDIYSESSTYYHYPVQMGLPPGLTGRGNQPVQTIHIVLKTSNGKTLLEYQGEVTNNPRATKLVEDWIKNVVERVQKTDNVTSETNNELIINAIGECPKTDYSDCRTEGDFETGFYMNCDVEVCDTGWNPPPPDEDPWEDDWGDPCDDPLYDCDSSGGSDGETGGGERDECEGRLQPDECEETCETGDPVIDDSAVEEAINTAWINSYGPDHNPLDDNDRRERMFMVIATNSGYEVEEIVPGPNTSPCHFDGGTIQVPSNIVALFHTHPFADGDSINVAGCPPKYDGDFVSQTDKNLVESFATNPQLPSIPLYVVDKDKIRVLYPSDTSQYSQTFDRCGP